MTLSDEDVGSLRRGQCPACKNWGFIPGPRGGAGQNIYCCNPVCRAGFMVAPRHNIHLAQRVGEAPDCHYPPQVHILSGGQALCIFHGYLTIDNGPPPRMVPVTPDMWPIGHSWVGREEFELATCPQCRTQAAS